jgi:hypothetical protein
MRADDPSRGNTAIAESGPPARLSVRLNESSPAIRRRNGEGRQEGGADAACPPDKASQAGTQRSQTYETVTLTPASRSQFAVVAVACTTALAFGA